MYLLARPTRVGDSRDYADVGGSQAALVAVGERLGTTDAGNAEQLAAQRVLELKERRAHRQRTGLHKSAALAEFASEHLQQKPNSMMSPTNRWKPTGTQFRPHNPSVVGSSPTGCWSACLLQRSFVTNDAEGGTWKFGPTISGLVHASR